MTTATWTMTEPRPVGWRRWLDAVGTAVVGAVSGETVAAEQPPLGTADLQRLLVDAGLLTPAAITGRPDDWTLAALRRFQATAVLRVDGVAGPRTVHALCQAAADARELRELGLAA